MISTKTRHDKHESVAVSPPVVRDKGKKPSRSQRAWLVKGLKQAGGKLPLFLDDGRQVSERTVQICIEQGWAVPCFANPIKPGWQVCRLTDKGRRALSASAS